VPAALDEGQVTAVIDDLRQLDDAAVLDAHAVLRKIVWHQIVMRIYWGTRVPGTTLAGKVSIVTVPQPPGDYSHSPRSEIDA
jgi:hypothetical protein